MGVDIDEDDLPDGGVILQGDAPIISWREFCSFFVPGWKQGQHVAIIGPTDSGKTTLALNLLPIHIWVVILATKPRDETLDTLIAPVRKYRWFGKAKALPAGKYLKMDQWDTKLDLHKFPRRILWPNALDLYSAETQLKVFKQALEIIYREGGWTLYMDELWFMSAELKMAHEIRMYLQQSRSNKVTLVISSQRPSRIPVEVYDQSRHLFFSRDNDERNLSRISGIAFQSRHMIMNLVANLEPHQFLYVNVLTGYMCRLTCPELQSGGKK
jgi:energy-coupling factor transporter ATP-binding protein EcfA2